MMNNIALICEGFTDAVFLQYIMRKLYGWEFSKVSPLEDKDDKLHARELKRKNDILTIISSGGCSRIKERLKMVLERNVFSAQQNEFFSKIVILTDNDEEHTIDDVKEYIKAMLQNVMTDDIEIEIENQKWFAFSMKNGKGQTVRVSLLPLIIPYDENGALETLLLKSLADKDPYDKEIIHKGNIFVDSIDGETRYLTGRRLVTKAKFDIYFSIRTPSEQYGQRQNILKDIPWEEYKTIRKEFAELGKL